MDEEKSPLQAIEDLYLNEPGQDIPLAPPNYPVDLGKQPRTDYNDWSPEYKEQLDNDVDKIVGSNLWVPNAQPFIPREPITKPRPGWFEKFGHNFVEAEEIIDVYDWATSSYGAPNPYDDPSDENYTPMVIETFMGIDRKYWPFLSQGKSANDTAARREWALNKMEEDEYFARGSAWAGGLGTLAGAALSPSSLIGIGAIAKYAKWSQSLLKSFLSIAPGMTLGAAAHEAVITGTAVDGNLQDFAMNTARDAAMGTILFGFGGVAFTRATTSSRMFNARKATSYNFEGITVNKAYDATGKYIGLKAAPAPGNTSVGAARVSEAQSFLNSKMVQSGLFTIPGVTRAISKINPGVRMRTSRFSSAAEYWNRFADDSIVTEGIVGRQYETQLADGSIVKQTLSPEVKENSAEFELGWSTASTAMKINHYRGLMLAANGIEGGVGVINATKSLWQRLTKNMTFTNEGFGKAVRTVLNTGEAHENGFVNEAAKFYKEEILDPAWNRFANARGFDAEAVNTALQREYVMRAYERPQMNLRQSDWEQMSLQEMKEGDARIRAINKPLEDIRQQLKDLQEIRKTKKTPDNLKELKRLKAEHERIKDLHEEQLRSPENAHLLENQTYLTKNAADELRRLLKPIEDLKKKQKKAKDELEKEAIKRQIDDEMFALETAANEGRINPELYVRDSRNLFKRFKDIEPPKFRALYRDDNHIITEAQAFYHRIMGNTPEQVIDEMLGTLRPDLVENPLKHRSLMIRDETLNKWGFLSNDLESLGAAYVKRLDRHSILSEKFQNANVREGLGALVQTLTDEHRAQKAAINANEKLTDAARKKELQKLDKEFTKTKKDMGHMYDKFMGRTTMSQGQQRFLLSMQNLAVSTRLGNVPITQIADLGAQVMKGGLFPFFRDGMVPALNEIKNVALQKKNTALREQMAHALVGMEHYLNGSMTRMYNSESIKDLSYAGRVENMLDAGAKISGNLFGTNYIENINHMIATGMAQSLFINNMKRFARGKLSARAAENMMKYGLDPKVWSKRFIQQQEKFGYSNALGGHQSNFHLWDDYEALNVMAQSIKRKVSDTIIKRGMFDDPILGAHNNMIWRMMTGFMGYAFAAFNRYTVPFLQRPDAEKFLGVATMLGFGMMVDPLRKMAKGQDYDFENDEAFFINGLTESGVLGWTMEAAQMANSIFAGKLFGGIHNDRYIKRTWAGLLAGPAGGLIQDYTDVITDTARNNGMTSHGADKLARGVPLINAWYLRKLVNDFRESLNLPD